MTRLISDLREEFHGDMNDYAEAAAARRANPTNSKKIMGDDVQAERFRLALAYLDEVATWPIEEAAKVDLIEDAYLWISRLVTLGTMGTF